VNDVSEFLGASLGDDAVRLSDIKGRVLSLAVPKESTTVSQREAIDAVRDWARTKNYNPVQIIITEF